MSPAVRVLLGLIIGFAVGLVAKTLPALSPFVLIIEPLGTLFVNFIRMTVLPLVVSTLIVGVASAGDARQIGRLGGRTVAMFVALLLIGGAVSLAVAVAAFQELHIDSAVSASLRSAANLPPDVAAAAPTLTSWILDLVPVNPVKAAADGAMLPVIVFTLAFGLAITQIGDEHRRAVVRAFAIVADVMLALVRGVLWFAPVGVFALAVALASRMGLAAAGAVASYVIVTVGLLVVLTAVVLYPAAVVVGRIALEQFVRGCAPAQAVAFSSRSSLAALPAMLEAGRTRLALGADVTGFAIPLGAAMFRFGAAINQAVAVVFLAQLYGIVLDPTTLLTVLFTITATTFSVPGVPAGTIISIAPVLLAAHVPVEGIGILLGIDAVPDMFRTATNATGQMTAAVMVARFGARAVASDREIRRETPTT